MSHGKESKASENRRNARRLVSGELNARNALWNALNPERHAQHQRAYAERSKFARKIEREINPITLFTDAIFVAGDAHVPFHHPGLIQRLCDAGKETGVKKLALIGDTWDCDNYSRFVRYVNHDLTFDDERDMVRSLLLKLKEVFTDIYITRGNHEKRWIALNLGRMGMQDLFNLTQVEGLTVSTDDHLYVITGLQKWLCCHPKSYRQIPLSLPKDLAAKHRCNVLSFHGHHFAQGWDRSGDYRIAEGGGLFDEAALEYQRDTYAGPRIRSGFYLLADNEIVPFEGR